MSRTFTVKFMKPFPAQQEILEKAKGKRFVFLTLGRRSGKTSFFGIGRTLDMALKKNKRIGYFAPNYKYSSDVWRELLAVLGESGLIKTKSTQERRIELVTGSSIDLWTMEDPAAGRGRRYHLVVVDEAAHVKNLKQAWMAAILPTLADFRGQAWFLTTPCGFNDYYEIVRKFEDKPYAIHFQMPTAQNPYISPDELEIHRASMSEAHFKQEFEASFEAIHARVVHNFSMVDNVLPAWKKQLPEGELLFGLDFNVSPMCGVLGYIKAVPEPDDPENPIDRLIIFDEIEIYDSGTEEMCNEIKARYGDRWEDIVICPDPTGDFRSTSSKNQDTTNFTIIEDHGFEIDADDVPKLQDKFNEANALACNALGTRRLFVTRNCKRMLSCLEQYAFKEGTGQPKKGKHDHMVDALCNIIHRRFPIDGELSFRMDEVQGI